MTTEQETFSDNLNNFALNLKGVTVRLIDLYTDPAPTFNKDIVPFKFLYCHSIGFHANSKYYHVFASQTSEGLNSFWVETKKPTSDPNQTVEINRTLINLNIVIGINNYPYQLDLDFGDKKIFLLCGEIYETIDPKVLDYKINDEMILFFENKYDIQEFETRINYR